MPRVELKFPLKGINKNWANSEQPPITSPDMNNVRPYGTEESRLRGGQRPGQAKMFSQQIGGASSPVVCIVQVTSMTVVT
jgi:hypothetical protein